MVGLYKQDYLHHKSCDREKLKEKKMLFSPFVKSFCWPKHPKKNHCLMGFFTALV